MTTQPVLESRFLAEELVIDDLATLKALADPLRQRIQFMCGDHPRTVKELAQVIGVPQTRLYYHVKILEKYGLIHVVDRRIVSGIEERTYSATAQSTTVSPELARSDLIASGALDALLGVVAAELQVALDSPTPIGDAEGTVPALSLTSLHLTREEVLEVQRKIIDIMAEYGPSSAREDTTEYHAILGLWQVGGSHAS